MIIETTFGGKVLVSTTDSKGLWRMTFPNTPAGGPYDIYFKPASLSKGPLAHPQIILHNVMFGDVFLCAGQSNMKFALRMVIDANTEIQRAATYSGRIRYLDINEGAASSPKMDFVSERSAWAIAGIDGFRDASAVCWLTGRTIADALAEERIHIGLISAALRSTRLISWAENGTCAHCAARTGMPSNAHGALWNGMIAPLTVGPMSLRGILWYQGEGDRGQASYYACAFPALIQQWRASFKAMQLFFGFIEVAPCGGGGEFRQAQRVAMSLLNVGVGSAADAGDAERGPIDCIHPRNKQTPAARLAAAVLAIVYGQAIAWQQPTAESAQVTATNATTTVEVRFSSASLAGGGLELDAALACPPSFSKKCAWPEIVGSSGAVKRASLSVTHNGTRLLFTAVAAAGTPVDDVPIAVRYAFGDWPIVGVFSTHRITTRYEIVRLPVVGFSIDLHKVALRDSVVTGRESQLALHSQAHQRSSNGLVSNPARPRLVGSLVSARGHGAVHESLSAKTEIPFNLVAAAVLFLAPAYYIIHRLLLRP